MIRVALRGLLAALAWSAASPVLAVPPNGDVSVELDERTPGLTPEVFRSALGGYGEWLVSPRHGEVWRPRVAAGWRPYYYGSWLWTAEGWYWDSDEPFAWAVYHYGRWVYDPAWGWVWVPGYVWAPAWVTWRYGVDAIGWAPLAPGVSVYVTAYPFVDFWWTFVPTVQFVGVPVYRVAYPPREVPRWFRATQPAPPRSGPAPARDLRSAPTPAWGGPAKHFIEERTGRLLTPVPRPAGAPAFPRPVERAPAAVGPGAPRDERWERPERERPDARPAPGAGDARPGVRPAPGPGEERPGVRPAPRQEERRAPPRSPAGERRNPRGSQRP